MAESEESPTASGIRLRALRQAVAGVGRTQIKFCEDYDIPQNTWNQYEKGKVWISRENALKLRRKLRVTLDWIYAGDDSMMPAYLAVRIRELLENPPEE